MIQSYEIVCREVDSTNDSSLYSGDMEYWSSSSYSVDNIFYLDDLKCRSFGDDYFLRDVTFSCKTD
uniref:Uncharacterized protein n=1 Tax=Romanomermis culicivorax TaxID=13658 RepID=A0A915IFP9_ROMCU